MSRDVGAVGAVGPAAAIRAICAICAVGAVPRCCAAMRAMVEVVVQPSANVRPRARRHRNRAALAGGLGDEHHGLDPTGMPFAHRIPIAIWRQRAWR